MRVEPEERQRRIAQPAMTADAFAPRAQEQEEEAHMMARWANMVQATVDSTERALGAATTVAAEAGREMRKREATAEREKELAHEYLVREVETTKALAANERDKAFEGRQQTTKLEQAQAEELAGQRIDFEAKLLAREAQHRENEAMRFEEEERWRLRRKEREEVLREEERIERCQKEEQAALAAGKRAQDLQRIVEAMDVAQREREAQLARREAEQEEQRRYRQRREAELEASRREEAELADNMIANLDQKYREQEQTAVAMRLAEANTVDRSRLERESRTRAPFRADRATEHLTLLEEVDNDAWQEEERCEAAALRSELDAEQRGRAAYRLQRGVQGASHPTAAMEASSLQAAYDQAASTVHDRTGSTQPLPPGAHIHNGEEYDYTPGMAAMGHVPNQERPLRRANPEGRLFGGTLTPRQEIELAREARHELERSEGVSAVEAARVRREEAEYLYSARAVHLAQLKARHEQYLAEATPSITAAQAAAASIQPEEVQAMFEDGRPPAAVQAVCVATVVILTGDTSTDFDQARRHMSNYDFVDQLRSFHSNGVGMPQIETVHQIMRSLDVEEVLLVSAGSAAASLLMWTANIARYNQVYSNVAPVRFEMAEASRALEEADAQRRDAAKQMAFLTVWRQ